MSHLIDLDVAFYMHLIWQFDSAHVKCDVLTGPELFYGAPFQSIGRRGGLMVSALDSGANGPGSSPGRGHCVVFLGKTLHSHSASLHPGVQMGTGEFNAGGNPAVD